MVPVGIVLVPSLLILLYALNLRLTGSTVSSCMAVVLTMLAGGVGGFVWLFTDFTTGGRKQ
jgi:hypothetical protein